MNLIYIHTHDTGRYISPYGYPADTPHILALARDATLFANSFCAAPTCSPSRASMLTGTYPHQNGMLGLAQRGFGLYDYQRHLVSYLKQQGYHTVLCGIQHEAGWYLNREDAAPLGYDENLTADAHQYRKEDLGQWDRHSAGMTGRSWCHSACIPPTGRFRIRSMMRSTSAMYGRCIRSRPTRRTGMTRPRC
jgi:arylsulfatase A-like enzyme